jgi:hypothetical protein
MIEMALKLFAGVLSGGMSGRLDVLTLTRRVDSRNKTRMEKGVRIGS